MRARLPAILIGLLLGNGAEARDLFVNNLAGYTIESRVLDAPNCDGPAFSDVTLQSFEKALCVFHLLSRSPADSEKVITLMQQAQTGMLERNQTIQTSTSFYQKAYRLLFGLMDAYTLQAHRLLIKE